MEREPAIPYYLQVAETIKRRILTDHYSQTDLIPPIQELEKEFNVSSITIRKALEILSQEGLIHRKRGIGTLIKKPEPEMITFELSGSFQRMVDSIDKLPLDMEVLEISTPPCPQAILQTLSIDPKKPVWRMRKIRKYKGTPISYYIHYCDPVWVDAITKQEGSKQNFVELFQRFSKISLTKLEQRLKAAVADLDLSKVLKIKFGAPLFFMENIYYGPQDKPVIFTQIYYRGDFCFYKATVQL